jgi:hypothetical protein
MCLLSRKLTARRHPALGNLGKVSTGDMGDLISVTRICGKFRLGKWGGKNGLLQKKNGPSIMGRSGGKLT